MKKSTNLLSMSFAIFAFASTANAEVTVSSKIVQQGLFRTSDCQMSNNEVTPAECLCRADIRYPEITGLGDAKLQTEINAKYKKQAEENKCEGETTSAAEKEGQYSSKSSYNIIIKSAKLIAIELNYSAYMGGAHGSDITKEDIIDIKTGKILSPNDVFTAKNIPAVNDVIYQALIEKEKKEEGILPDSVEERKGAFIKENKCNDCNIKVDKKGVSVVFDNYAVSSFAAGPQTIVIPDELIGNYDIISALAGKK